MANGGLSFPTPSINAPFAGGGGQVQPGFLEMLLASLAQQLGPEAAESRLRQQVLRTQQRTAEFDLQQKQAAEAAASEAERAAFMGAVGEEGMGGITAPVLEAAGSARTPQSQVNAMIRAAAGGTAEAPSPIATRRAQLAEAKQLEKSRGLVAGLLTDEELQGYDAAMAMQAANMPKEIYQQFLPQGRIELAQAGEELKAIRNKTQSEEYATQQLIRFGVLPEGTKAAENAPKLLLDYIGAERDRAQEARLAAAERQQSMVMEDMKGIAGALAASNPTWTSNDVRRALENIPQYQQLPQGILATAAIEVTRPKTEVQARQQQQYQPARRALTEVMDLTRRGIRLDAKADLAQLQTSGGLLAAAAGGGALAGRAAGAAVGGRLGTAGGAVGGIPGMVAGAVLGTAAGAVAPSAIRGFGRGQMSTEQQQLLANMNEFLDAIARGRTGAAYPESEKLSYAATYTPFKQDKPETIRQKQELMLDMFEAFSRTAGYAEDVRSQILTEVAQRHQLQLLTGNVPRPAVQDTRLRARTPRTPPPATPAGPATGIIAPQAGRSVPRITVPGGPVVPRR